MNHFDNEFQKYLAEMIETGFELAGNNSGKFKSNLSYDKTFTRHNTKAAQDVYEDGFPRLGA